MTNVVGKRTARVVIGAGYGDEGKGAAVDRLAGPGTIVARFNGGAQAGHTVVAPDGRRHVFHHVGSGSFHGAATYLSRHVVSSPMHLVEELEELAALGVAPTLFADPRGLVATPFDMLLNQAVESARGIARHGSCGYGVGETIERTERGPPITLGDLADTARLRQTLWTIRATWVPARCAALGLTDMPAAYAALLADDALIEAYVAVAGAVAHRLTLSGPEMLTGAEVVFEGAQGLALDQARGAFPFVTRSNTGLHNALEVAAAAGLGRLEVIYATRCYQTRHGAGPLPGEVAAPPVPRFADATNVPNDWQGTLRFAPLDAAALAVRVEADLGDARGTGIEIAPSLAVSCLDQAGPSLPVIWDGKLQDVATDALAPLLVERLGFTAGVATYGASRGDVVAITGPRKAA